MSNSKTSFARDNSGRNSKNINRSSELQRRTIIKRANTIIANSPNRNLSYPNVDEIKKF